ncbi:malate:quinone oxidoreductase [Agrococcus sp. TF02-05]|uniref:malate:quinone oxidoreductase n=1 Tax=Agrococcus sp. TF02-05 TaxID=2815211 RepID=UPI001AA1C150|nr:malate:quinone oxidoreductase [Agrococcus sp. TF02-05]MBO1770312.1 malate:quinone oxidoreductase [Agrococcus sp. TF02-05]
MTKTIDVALIGGGIMSATLGALLHRLEPSWRIEVYERLPKVGMESSDPWNNAGTGHAALCELNYMPEGPDGSMTAAKAIDINEQFQLSRQLWASFVEDGTLPDPKGFISPTPHMTFVWGDANVDYLRRRWELLKDEPLFRGIEYSEDPEVIREWAPTLIPGRKKSQRIAATRSTDGTDVDFGALTRMLFAGLVADGAKVYTDTTVTGLKRRSDGLWRLKLRHEVGQNSTEIHARFVFVGGGGGALKLLQKSRIPEAKGFAGFPITGAFLRTDNPEVVARHNAKVYGKASVGAPPMSVPHLDTRVVDGEASLLFGPYAGWSPKYLKTGSYTDMFETIKGHNLYPMVRAGLANLDLVGYLMGEVFASRSQRLEALREFMPNAKDEDWRLITAGQRVQVMKKDPEKGGVLQFGTEVVTGAEGTIAGLLGASPGASTAVHIMLTIFERCFPERLPEWRPKIQQLIPSYGTKLNDDPEAAREALERTARVLRLVDTPSSELEAAGASNAIA